MVGFASLTFITLTEDNVHNKVQRFSTELYMYMYHGPEAGGVNAHIYKYRQDICIIFCVHRVPLLFCTNLFFSSVINKTYSRYGSVCQERGTALEHGENLGHQQQREGGRYSVKTAR